MLDDHDHWNWSLPNKSKSIIVLISATTIHIPSRFLSQLSQVPFSFFIEWTIKHSVMFLSVIHSIINVSLLSVTQSKICTFRKDLVIMPKCESSIVYYKAIPISMFRFCDRENSGKSLVCHCDHHTSWCVHEAGVFIDRANNNLCLPKIRILRSELATNESPEESPRTSGFSGADVPIRPYRFELWQYHFQCILMDLFNAWNLLQFGSFMSNRDWYHYPKVTDRALEACPVHDAPYSIWHDLQHMLEHQDADFLAYNSRSLPTTRILTSLPPVIDGTCE